MEQKNTFNENTHEQEIHKKMALELENLLKALDANFYTINDIEDIDYTLGLAASYDNLKLAKILLKNKANPNVLDPNTKQNTLFFTKTAEMILLLAKYGANINLQNKNGSTPLSVFTCRSEIDKIKTLLELGADPNIVNCEGNSPLIFAAFLNKPEILTLLLGYGADKRTKNNIGLTTLDYAKDRGHTEIIKLLEK